MKEKTTTIVTWIIIILASLDIILQVIQTRTFQVLYMLLIVYTIYLSKSYSKLIKEKQSPEDKHAEKEELPEIQDKKTEGNKSEEINNGNE